jgi:hypothetical protein
VDHLKSFRVTRNHSESLEIIVAQVLLYKLEKKNVSVTGRIRSDRKYFPVELKEKGKT